MIEIRHFFTEWHEVSREKARKFISCIIPQMVALPHSEKIKFIENKRLRGITVAELFKQDEKQLDMFELIGVLEKET